MAISVSMTVLPEDQDTAAKTVDAMARVAAGLAFEGQTVSLTITNYDLDEEDPNGS